MRTSLLFSSLLFTVIVFNNTTVYAADAVAKEATKPEQNVKKQRDESKEKMKSREQVYGSSLMTEEERIKHREHMQSAKTEEEREQIRQQHHEKMAKRAKEQGVSLPEDPAMRGKKTGWTDGEHPGQGKAGAKPDKYKSDNGNSSDKGQKGYKY